MMISSMIILEMIFLVFSGIYYMSLNVYTEKVRFFRKRVLLAGVLLGMSVPGLVIYPLNVKEPDKWMYGFFCVSFLLAILALGWLLVLWMEHRKGKCRATMQEPDGALIETRERFSFRSFLGTGGLPQLDRKPVGIKEFGLLIGLTVLYGVLVFYRLGSSTTPQTSLELVSGGTEDEIILDLGEEKEVAGIEIYQGHTVDRIAAFSYYDEETQEWIPIDQNLTLESSYCWNTVEIHQKLRYLGIVSRSGTASYHEVVILDENDDKLLPVNAREYAVLFDEQELYPEEMTYYDITMFDEVYYAGSAYECLNGMVMYERTHPPMGKILIAIGEALFGVTPFGWRFVGAVCGVLAVPLFFLLLYLLTANSRIALLGTVLYCLDFMHYTLSRIATLDSLVAFWILLMVTLLLVVFKRADRELSEGRKRPSLLLVACMALDGLAVGMGVSTKWTGFYAMLGMALLFLFFVGFWMRRLNKSGEKVGYPVRFLLWGLGIYSILPFAVYLLSFLPQMRAQGTSDLFTVMWDSSKYMLDFHSGIVFEHPYESPWYSWILDLIPLVDSGNIIGDDRISLVVTMGNPLIWWAGAAAFLYLLVRVICQKDKTAAVLCFCYLMMLIPWVFVKRTVFIYQYDVSSIFLCGILGYALYLVAKKKKQVIPVFLEASLFLFLIFFPVLSGVTVSVSHVVLNLMWFESWQFVF